MRVVDRYPIVVTPKLEACRDFWVGRLGFAVVFEAQWFVLLQADGASLVFIRPDHPFAPPGPEVFSGKGAIAMALVELLLKPFSALVQQPVSSIISMSPARSWRWRQGRSWSALPPGSIPPWCSPASTRRWR